MIKRLLLIIILISASIPLYTYLTSIKNRDCPYFLQTHAVKPSSTSIAIDDFSFTEYTVGGAGKKFTIEGKRLAPTNKSVGMFKTGAVKVAKLKNVAVTFYENNMLVSRINSKTAILDMGFKADNELASLSDRISFSDDVTMTTEDKRVLLCDKLNLDKKEGRVIASGRCVLLSEGKRVKADTIVTDISLRDYSVRKDRKRPIESIPLIAMFR